MDANTINRIKARLKREQEAADTLAVERAKFRRVTAQAAQYDINKPPPPPRLPTTPYVAHVLTKAEKRKIRKLKEHIQRIEDGTRARRIQANKKTTTAPVPSPAESMPRSSMPISGIHHSDNPTPIFGRIKSDGVWSDFEIQERNAFNAKVPNAS